MDDGADGPARIARLGPSDWELLRDLRLAALRDAPHAFWAKLSDEIRYDRETWLSFLTGVAWFVARSDNGDSLGVAGLHQSDDSAPEVIGMWVVPGERGHGIGAQLTLAAVRQAEHQGARSVELWVTDGNDTASRMYQRLGFHFTGESAPLPHDSATGERKMSMSLGEVES